MDLQPILEYLNRERAMLNLVDLDALPKGEPTSPCRCVISQALTPDGRFECCTLPSLGFTTVIDTAVHDIVVTIRHPQYVLDFANAFDAGDFPELEL